jgi:RsfA family transcription factor
MSKNKRNETNNLQGDIWTAEDDALLAETILRNVREGNTVIDGCREIEVKTNGKRTAPASKFRWFTKIVEQYKAGYELAKIEGAKVKQAKKRKTNKGERFEEIVKEVFESEIPSFEKEIDPDDFIILAKKFKEQQSKKKSEESNHEKTIKELQRKNERLEKELNDAKKEADWYNELLLAKQRDYNKIVEALGTLKNLGVSITIPEPESPKYKIEKDGTVSKL